MGATVDSLDIQISAEMQSARASITLLNKKLSTLSSSLLYIGKSLSKISDFSKTMNGLNENMFEGFADSAKTAETSMNKLAKEASKGIRAKATFDISDYEKVSDELGKKFAGAGKNIRFSGNLSQLEKQYESLSKSFDKLVEKEQKIVSVGTTSPESTVFKGLQYDISGTLNKMEVLSEKIKSLKIEAPYVDLSKLTESELDNWLKSLPSSAEKAKQTLVNFDEELKHFNDVINSGGQESEAGTIFPISGIEMTLEQLRNLYPEATNLISAFESAAERARQLTVYANQDFGNIDLSAFDKAGKKVRDFGQKTEEAKKKIQEVDSASKKTSGIDKLSFSFTKASNSGKKLSKTLSKMQNNFKNLLRSVLPFIGTMQAINFTKSSVTNAMEYIETLNYFDAAFGQVAQNADLSAFRERGYDSADAYYNSFADRAEELTAKMSGFTIGESGMLQATGAVSLGLDPSQFMNYQAMFGQMSSSMGVASETAIKLSQVLTEIGADLASVKNMKFEDVWEDMASGLAGMSRTLDKYGANIRNVNLQQKLNELGIEANVSALNQNDKALLRAIILLDSTRYAWADLADTINQPANQLRLIEANFKNLSRTIGSLFMPVVQKVLPYINALVIATQRLFSWLANLIGIDLSGISTVVGGADLGNILDQTENLENGLSGAKKATDKLNKSLQKFDELNVITTNLDSGSGVGVGGGIGGGLLDAAFNDAFNEYQKVWDEAFSNLENKAQEIADSIEKAFAPIKKIIQDFAIGDFFQAGKDVSALVVSITDFFANAIDKVDWYGIGQKIGDFLAGIDWLKILKSVGNLIWQALKAAFELYVGAFSAAPLETALISLVAMPKLLKAITASKIVTGVVKLRKNFGIWGEKLELVAGSLVGNKAAASGLAMLYPKLGEKVDTVKTAFSNFGKSVSQKGLWKTIDGGITQVRNSLGVLQKGAITAVAGFAEFAVVSDTFKKLTDGSENLVAGLAKIGAAVGLAGAAMYTALGPAGLAITAIVGVAGAIKGITDAFDEIRAEEIGNVIKNAMSNPGGTPIDEIASQFSNAIGKIGDSFSIITEKSAGLETADKNIKNTWLEIEKIETSMDAGVLSVEDGTAELSHLFGELAQTASDKFGQLEDTLIAAFGENGVLNEVFERLGISTDNTTSMIIQLNDKVEKRIQELTELLASTDPSNPNYAIYKEELSALMAQTSDLTKAMNDYDLVLNQIDYSSILSDKGELNTEELAKVMNEISESTENAKERVADAVSGLQNSLQAELNAAIALGEMETAEEIRAKMDALPDALSLLNSDIELKATELTDKIQVDFIDKTNDIIENAQKEWGEKSDWDKFWGGVFGPGTESEYIKEAVEQQQKNVDKLSETLEQSFSSLQTEGVVWASDAAKEIYGALFDSKYVRNDVTGGKTVYTLNENYKDIINGATEGIAELAAERGKDAVDGYTLPFGDTEATKNAVRNFINDSLGVIPEEQNSHSPSKVTEGYGKDAVDGYTIGIESNTENTISAVSIYTRKVLDKFSEMINPLREIGINAMQGLFDGLSSMENDIYSKAGEIADNVAKTVKNSLEIHSPSRVMFRLGDYTMQGFQNGLENLYQSIIHSMKDFSYELQVAPTSSLTDMHRTYDYMSTDYFPKNSVQGYQINGYNQNSTETNRLLSIQNELLRAILNKPNIGNDDIFNAARTVYKGEAIRRYGNSAAFDPVWG